MQQPTSQVAAGHGNRDGSTNAILGSGHFGFFPGFQHPLSVCFNHGNPFIRNFLEAAGTPHRQDGEKCRVCLFLLGHGGRKLFAGYKLDSHRTQEGVLR